MRAQLFPGNLGVFAFVAIIPDCASARTLLVLCIIRSVIHYVFVLVNLGSVLPRFPRIFSPVRANPSAPSAAGRARGAQAARQCGGERDERDGGARGGEGGGAGEQGGGRARGQTGGRKGR
eukprot:1862110-Pyramimonas_sp.AAC.1